jgi:hypothetical protein
MTTNRPTVTTTTQPTVQTTSFSSTVPTTNFGSGYISTPELEYGSGNIKIDRWLDVFAFVADNAYGIFANSDNNTADFKPNNETAHEHNGTRDDDSRKAYWGDSWAASFTDDFYGKEF